LKNKNIKILNGLRGLAALIVFISHSANLGIIPKGLGSGFGAQGVIIFFVLSGFLMSYLYLDSSPDRVNIMRYAKHRVFRVMPLYLIIVLVSYLSLRGGYQLYEVSNSNIVEHLLFIEAGNVLWTIPVELQFYILFGFIWFFFYRISATKLIVLVLVFIVCFYTLQYYLYMGYKGGINNNSGYLVYWIQFFLFGLVMGLLYKKKAAEITDFFKSRSGFWLAQFSIVLFLISLPGIRVFLEIYRYPNYLDLISTAPTVLVVFFTLSERGLFAVLNLKLFQYLGKISYSFYLFHYPILFFIYSLISPEVGLYGSIAGFIVFVISLIVVILVSSFSFYMIENKIMLHTRKEN
jgi:peptidoglycan/LPS O-acetylase OafA/YrhL